MYSPSIIKVGFVILGGAFGTAFRYMIAAAAYHHFGAKFPWGTLWVNLIGCFVIGLLWGSFEKIYLSTTMKAFFFIGILGGFTTFSSFAMESFNLFRSDFKLALLNIIIHNVGGIALAAAGYGLILFLIARY